MFILCVYYIKLKIEYCRRKRCDIASTGMIQGVNLAEPV